MFGLEWSALLIILFAVVILETLAIASYRLGQTMSVFAITFIELLALSVSHYGSVFGIPLEHRFLFGGIFLSILPAAILAAYLLIGIRAARALLVTLTTGIVGYTMAWAASLSAAPLFGNTPLEVVPATTAWVAGWLGILAETAGFFAVVPLYSFLGRTLRFPRWARIAVTLAFVPLANGAIMSVGLLYPETAAYSEVFATTLAARALVGLLLSPGFLILLRIRVPETRNAPVTAGPLDVLTQLTATRRSLETAEARYRAMFVAAPDAILRFDEKGVIREINQHAEQELGYEAGKLVGAHVWSVWGPTEDRMEAERRIRVRLKNIQAGQVSVFDGLAQRSDGSFLPVEVSLTPVAGPAPGFLAVAHDLSRQKRDRARLERQVAELNTLAEVANIASSAQDLDGLLKASVDRVAEIVGADTCYVTLWDERRDQVVFSAASGPDHERFRALAPSGREEEPSLTGTALAESHPLIVHDYPHSRYYRSRLVFGAPLQSVLALPLIGNGQKLGGLVIGHFQPHTFSPEEVGTLERAANLIALSVGRMRLLEQTRERQRLAESLRTVGIAFGSTLDYEEILDRILDGLSQVMSCDAANIQLIQNGLVRVIRSRGYEEFGLSATADGTALPLDDTPLIKRMLEERRTVVVADVRNEPDWRVPPDWGDRPQFWRSWVGAPVIVRGEVIGFINADSATPGAYTDSDAQVLALFAAQAAIALGNSRLYAEAQEQRAIAETLRQAAVVLGQTLDTEAILDQILVILEQVVPYKAANIQMIREGRIVLSRLRGYDRVGAGADRAAREAFFFAEDVPNLRLMIETRKPHFISDTWGDPAWTKVPGLEWLRSWAAAPIVVRGEVIGFINVDGTEPGAYSERHAELLQVFAQQAASALENALLYEQTERRILELTAIYESGRRLQALHPPDVLAQEALNALTEIVGYDHGSVMLTNLATGDLVTVALREQGYNQAEVDAEIARVLGFGIRVGTGITGWVAEHGESVRAGDAPADPRYLSVRPDIRSELCVPLRVGEQTIGVVNVESTRANAYTEADQRLLETIAAQVAIAVENARLYEDLQAAYDQLKASQAQVMRSERLRALGQMASGIAHDFNNVLTPIMGYLELALEHPELPENARGDVERARRGALAASGIVARLREFYRPRDTAEPFAPLEINRVIRDAVDLTRPRWRDIPQEHGLVIDVRLELGQVPLIQGDASALRDLLTNLILNAVDAMPRGGAITIRTRRDGDFALLEVSDTGMGMSEEARQRAFEPFFSTKGQGGTGLGLSICYGIARRHGGTIDLQSAPGKGVTVSVRLPTGAVEPAKPAEPALPPLPALNILLVDDEEPVLTVVSRMLSRAGHTVIAAKTGKAGIEKFAPEKVDVVITDLGMPQVTGRDVARAVKARSPRTPVILLTGWGAKVGQETSAPRDVDDVVSKPVQSADLHRSLAKVLGILPDEPPPET